VPETPVNENGQLGLWEAKIGFSKKLPAPSPAREPRPPKNLGKSQLRGAISTALNLGQYCRPLFCENTSATLQE
jgi:hypothetical protein